MSLLADGLVLLVAALHGYFLVLEMVLRRTDRGMKTFGTDPEFAARSATLAANQGLYDGFRAAGLIRGVLAGVLSGAGGPRSVSRR
jgi:putative membrane protein